MNIIQFAKHELELLESRIFDKEIILENEIDKRDQGFHLQTLLVRKYEVEKYLDRIQNLQLKNL